MNAKMTELDQLTVAVRIFKPDIHIAEQARTAGRHRVSGRGPTCPASNAPGRRRAAHDLTAWRDGHAGPLPNIGDRVLWKLIRGRRGHSLANLRKKGFAVSRAFGGGRELEWWSTVRMGEPTRGWRNGTTGE